MLTTHHLDQLPPQIQRFRLRLMRFSIESMVHVPGKEMYAPDNLSRMLARNTDIVHKSKNVDDFNAEIEVFLCSVLDAFPVSDVKLQQIIDRLSVQNTLPTLF